MNLPVLPWALATGYRTVHHSRLKRLKAYVVSRILVKLPAPFWAAASESWANHRRNPNDFHSSLLPPLRFRALCSISQKNFRQGGGIFRGPIVSKRLPKSPPRHSPKAPGKNHGSQKPRGEAVFLKQNADRCENQLSFKNPSSRTTWKYSGNKTKITQNKVHFFFLFQINKTHLTT